MNTTKKRRESVENLTEESRLSSSEETKDEDYRKSLVFPKETTKNSGRELEIAAPSSSSTFQLNNCGHRLTTTNHYRQKYPSENDSGDEENTQDDTLYQRDTKLNSVYAQIADETKDFRLISTENVITSDGKHSDTSLDTASEHDKKPEEHTYGFEQTEKSDIVKIVSLPSSNENDISDALDVDEDDEEIVQINQNYDENRNDIQILQDVKEKQILPDQGEIYLKNARKETFDFYNTKESDVLKMNGMLGTWYGHYVVVLSKDEANKTITVLEYSLRQDKWLWLIPKTILWSVVFQDPLAVLAQVQESTYTIETLQQKEAKKLIFPEELQKYVNKDKTLANAQKLLKEQDRMYSLSLHNCEHLSCRCVSNVSLSCQADQYWWLFEAISLAVQLITSMGINAICPSLSGVYGLVLAVYHNNKLNCQRELGCISDSDCENQKNYIWCKEFITHSILNMLN